MYTDSSGTCAAFLSNLDDKNDKTVMFRNMSYHLPAWSVSILPDCKNEVFNSAKVTITGLDNGITKTQLNKRLILHFATGNFEVLQG